MPDRRQFMVSMASVMAASSLPLAHSAKAGLLDSNRQGGVVVYRAGSQQGQNFALALQSSGVTAIALVGDPVRQWRDSLGQVIEAQSEPFYGLTDWSDYQLMRGLAAELRRHVRHESVYDDRQQTLYTWVIT